MPLYEVLKKVGVASSASMIQWERGSVARKKHAAHIRRKLQELRMPDAPGFTSSKVSEAVEQKQNDDEALLNIITMVLSSPFVASNKVKAIRSLLSK